MRRNILDWFGEQFTAVSHAVVLTHNIDFLFVQSVLVPRLRAMGQPRLTIFADAMCAAGSYRDQRQLLDGLGIRYRVVSVDLGPGRRFHPKAILLCNPERAAVAIGSGNLTHGGISANHEAWALGVSDGDGANLIGGLRDYLRTVCDQVPLAAAIRDAMDAVFSADHAWVPGLPPASGLAMSPGERPLLDQIAELIGDELSGVRLLAPYYDDEGAALQEIAKRFAVPVRAYLQPGRAGLSQSAAKHLPPTVNLGSVTSVERPSSFLHAKILAFDSPAGSVLAVGSANCSRAALLLQGVRGNAELMAVQALPADRTADFFEDLVLSDEAPELPEHPPSEDWEMEAAPPLRILAARREGDRLEIAFKSQAPVSDLTAISAEGNWQAVHIDHDQSLASFLIPLRLTKVQIAAPGSEGALVASEEAWVDDEASLATPASIRRILKGLQGTSNERVGDGDAYAALLELYPDYIRDPEAARRRIRENAGDGVPRPYDPATVFSDTFGRASTGGGAGSGVARGPGDLLSIVAALFGVGGEIVEKPKEPPPDDDEDPDGADEEQKIIAAARPQAPGVSRQLKRALTSLEKALSEASFIEGRRPDLLGADLALAAILLAKGLADKHLDPVDYRETTRRLWAHLFFGIGGAPGALTARLDALASDERQAFIRACATPRLTAALMLWSLTEWAANDAEGLWFRTSAVRLHSRHPWLFASAPESDVEAELRLLAATLLPANEQTFVSVAWTRLIKAGEALRLLEAALEAMDPGALRSLATSATVTPSDLLWQKGTFAVPTATYRRDNSAKAKIRLLGQSEVHTFQGGFLVPIRDVIVKDGLGLPPLAIEEIERFLSTAITVDGR